MKEESERGVRNMSSICRVCVADSCDVAVGS
jgi:hypothetical protein